MQPSAMLKDAAKSPDKFGVEDYLETIWLLRCKGNTWREIADFLNEKGIKTDHTRVYRLVMEGNPQFDLNEAGVIHGDVQYESRKGRPLRPYRAGLHIAIAEKGNCLVLENPEGIHSAWCECHFQLSAAPNHIWLQQLHKELNAIWNSEMPFNLKSKNGYELKFEGSLMALVCQVFNLKDCCEKLRAGIQRTTTYFQEDKRWLPELMERKKQRKKKIAKLYSPYPGQTIDEICEEHSKEYSKQSEALKKKFAAISI